MKLLTFKIETQCQRTKPGTFARHTNPTHKSQPCKRACLVPTLPGHTLLRWAHTFSSTHQDEGRTYSRVSKGISPPAPHRTVREPLDSYGSSR